MSRKYSPHEFENISHYFLTRCDYLTLEAHALLSFYLGEAGQDEFCFPKQSSIIRNAKIGKDIISKYDTELIKEGFLYKQTMSSNNRFLGIIRYINFNHPILKPTLDNDQKRTDRLDGWSGPNEDLKNIALNRFSTFGSRVRLSGYGKPDPESRIRKAGSGKPDPEKRTITSPNLKDPDLKDPNLGIQTQKDLNPGVVTPTTPDQSSIQGDKDPELEAILRQLGPQSSSPVEAFCCCWVGAGYNHIDLYLKKLEKIIPATIQRDPAFLNKLEDLEKILSSNKFFQSRQDTWFTPLWLFSFHKDFPDKQNYEIVLTGKYQDINKSKKDPGMEKPSILTPEQEKHLQEDYLNRQREDRAYWVSQANQKEIDALDRILKYQGISI